MRFAFLISLFAFMACSGEMEELGKGRWSGKLDTGNREVDLFLDYENDFSLLSIPEQGLIKVPVSDFSFSKDKIKFILTLGTKSIRFEGRLSQGSIKGIYLQDGYSGTFTLSLSGPVPDEKPVAIMEAEGEDKDLTLNSESVTLSGRLRLPFGDEGKWAALIIPGSGPTDGDGNSALLRSPNNSLLRLANYFAGLGIPSIRIDKRGTGASASAAEEEVIFDDFVDDAAAWLHKLKGLYPERKILVIGHSQGGLVGMLAANAGGCDAYISISAPGFPIDAVIENQIASLSPELSTRTDEILVSLREGRLFNHIPPALNGLFRVSVQPFLISYIKYDPAEVVKSANYPILVVQGEKDQQTGVHDAQKLMQSVESGELVVLPFMNHLLRDVHDDIENRSTYGEDRLPLSSGLTKTISEFLGK